MELKLLHLYADCMSLYGEWANLALLRRRLEALGNQVELLHAGFDQAPDFAAADFVFMGPGTERSQKAVLADLRPQGEALAAALEAGTPMLFTGTAFELLGRHITSADGGIFDGLSLADFTVEETSKRLVGDVYGPCSLTARPVVGFLNKCSLIRGVETPLLERCDLGFGNEKNQGGEGLRLHNLCGTHLTGPVLVKNPDLAAHFVQAIYAKRGEALPPAQTDEASWEEKGYQVTLRELQKRRGE